MTTDYKTITLVNVPTSANADVDDARYTYEAQIRDDADRDGKPDFFETKRIDRANIDPTKLLMPSGLTKRAGRLFVDNAGAVWRGEYVMTKGDDGKPKSNLVAYEREDGTPMDDNPSDGEFYIAPADIGRAFRGEEFKGFVSAVITQSKFIDDMEKREGITPETRTGPKYIDRIALYGQYLDKARALNALNATAYPLPDGVAARAPSAPAPPTVRPEIVPPAPPPEQPISTDDPVKAQPAEPAPMPIPADAGQTAPKRRLPIDQFHAVTRDSIKDGDLAVIATAIAQIRRYEVGALPLDRKGNQLSSVTVKGDRIVNQEGDARFMNDAKTYTANADDIFRLHGDLLSILRSADPESYYFGFAGARITSTPTSTTTTNSGTVTFTDTKRDIAKALGVAELDALAEILKTATPAKLSAITLTSSASATGEKVKDAKGKITKLNQGNLAEFMDTATGQLKAGNTWAESPMPNTANKAAAEKGAQAVLTYLRDKGVSEEILTTLKQNTSITGGAVKPQAKVEFTVSNTTTVPSASPVAVESFTGIPEDKQAALKEFLDVTLKQFFDYTRRVENNPKLDFTTEKKYIINKAALTADTVRQTFGEIIAGSIARQLAVLLAEQTAVPGAPYLAKVLDKEFPQAPTSPDKDAPPPPAPPVEATPPDTTAATAKSSTSPTPPLARVTSGASATPPSPAKDKDKISFGAKTAFTVGTTAPSVTVIGDISRIAKIRSAEENLGNQDIAFRADSDKLILDGLIKLSRTVRERGVTDDPLETNIAANNKGKPYGVRAYKLTVVYADGSTESLTVTADKIGE